jgi:hypothetical protein
MHVEMKLSVEESLVVRGFLKKVLPAEANVDKSAEVSGVFGSMKQEIDEETGLVSLEYSLDSRVVPGIISVYEKHLQEAKDIVILGKSLFSIVSRTVKSFVDDLNTFVTDFRRDRELELEKESA